MSRNVLSPEAKDLGQTMDQVREIHIHTLVSRPLLIFSMFHARRKRRGVHTTLKNWEWPGDEAKRYIIIVIDSNLDRPKVIFERLSSAS